LGRRIAVALLPAAVILSAFAAGPRPTLASVLPIHLATLAGALAAFWLVPRKRPAGDAADTFGLLRGICVVVLAAGITWGFTAGVWAADVREAALPWAWLLFDAALLFLLANRGARHAPYVATLATAAVVLAGAWGLPAMHRGASPWRAFESPRLNAFTPRLQRLARQAAASAPLSGIGLGNLARRAAGEGIPVVGVAWPRAMDPSLVPDLIQPALSQFDPKTASEAPAVTVREAAPPRLSSLALYTVEVGVTGLALSFAFAAYLIATALYAILRALTSRGRAYEFPPTGLALLASAMLAGWCAMLVGGLRGDFLRQPIGVLATSGGGGLLWGLVRLLLAATAERSSAAYFGAFSEAVPAAGSSEYAATGAPEGKHPLVAAPPRRRWPRLVPVPFALILGLACYLPLWGERLAGSAARAEAAGDAPSAATEQQLRRAAFLNPFSSEAQFLLARHIERRLGAAGSGASELAARAEDAYFAARKRDPYRDDIAAAQARFHMMRQQNFKMTTTITDGLRHSPESLLLTLWAAQAAEVTGNTLLLEAAWDEAVRLALSEQPDVAVYLLERLIEFHESRGNNARALGLACLLFQIRPGNLAAGAAIRRLAAKAG
jgi:hypothetical protein